MVKKNHGVSDTTDSKQKKEKSQESEEGPMEYVHKGELILEKIEDKEILKVIGKGEDAEVPIETYLEYLRNPEKFKCFVTFKLKIKLL